MAQDATYQTKVYHDRDVDRDGDRLVVASDGTIAIESGGSLAIYSGGQMTIADGANFEIADGDIVAADLRRLIVSEFGANVVITPLLNSAKLAVSNVPKNARIVTIIGSTAMTAGSIWMTSVSAGRELLLRVVGDLAGTFANAGTSIRLYTSGCILLNSLGGKVTTLHMQTSAASDTFILFKAVADDTWAVVADGGHPTET